MEVMDAPLDKFYKKIYENKDRIPEDVLSIVAFSVSVPLHSFQHTRKLKMVLESKALSFYLLWL